MYLFFLLIGPNKHSGDGGDGPLPIFLKEKKEYTFRVKQSRRSNAAR